MEKDKMLIVEDSELNCTILNEIFKDRCDITICGNGQEALNNITYEDKYDVILLDLMMPVMDGFEFLKRLREKFPECVTPVIVITVDNDIENQKRIFELGATDYIFKPFEPTIVYHRVNNACKAYKTIKKIKARNKVMENLATIDQLTRLLNRGFGEMACVKYLDKQPDENIGLIIIDIDNFKLVNDLYGHQVGDSTIKVVADLILSHFDSDDISFRLGGDEFVVLMKNMESVDDVTIKISELNRILHFSPNITIPANVTLSAGISYGKKKTFDQMYKEADEALYVSKINGRNQFTVFGKNIKVEDVLSHHDRNIFCLSRNRMINELLSSISIGNYGYLLIGSLKELDNIKVDFEDKECILIVDVSNEKDYEGIIDHLLGKPKLFPLLGIIEESNMKQMVAFSKCDIADLITYPTSKTKLTQRIERIFDNYSKYTHQK